MYQIAFREAALAIYQKIPSLRTVAQLLGISHSSLARWWDKIQPKKWIRSPVIGTTPVVDLVRNILSHTPIFTCSQLVSILAHNHHVRISRQLVYSILRRLGFSFKRSKRIGRPHASENAEERISKIQTFITMFKHFKNSKSLVALDECGFDHRCVPVYAYSRKGSPAVLNFNTSNDRVRYTLLMAIECDRGTSHHTILRRSCDGTTFASFLDSLPFPQGTAMLLDNASIHKTQRVKDTAERKGWYLLFPPPYSPEANPIEFTFGIIKNTFYKLRYSPSFLNISDLIRDSLGRVSCKSILNCFCHVESSFSR